MPKRGRPVSGLTLGIGFPQRLYHLRWSQGTVLTQKAFAEELEISRAYYCQLENGSVSTLSEARLRRIAGHFNIEHQTLAREPGEPPLPLKSRSYRRGHNLKGHLMNVGKGFPARLYDVRWDLGLTQGEFGERVGAGLSTINRLEMGRRLPTQETFMRVVEATEKDASWWYGGPGEAKLVDVLRG